VRNVAIAGLMVLLAVLAVEVVSGGLSLARLQEFATWVDSLGPVGQLAYGSLYFLLELVSVPALPLTVTCGYLFGVVRGALIVVLASNIASCCAFLTSRYAFRSFMIQKAKEYPKWRAMDKAVAREGFKFVLLLRLSPLLPFSISNYLFGLTSVEFVPYLLATALGMFPGTIAYLYAGAAVGQITDIQNLARGGAQVNPALLALSIAATVAVIYNIGRVASKAVFEETDDQETTSP